MKTLALILSLLLVTPAFATEAVDIQCRVFATASIVVIDSQVHGAPGTDPYWNCNVPMPYVTPVTNWLCMTDVTVRVTVPGAYAVVNHDPAGQNHDYHGFTVPPAIIIATPMAFPPGDPLKIVVYTPSGGNYTRIRVAGYLGRASATRETACLP